ncbi:fatty acid CoA ligase family protein [Streptomyces sp. NPDC020597]|uniref:fatty acid CoA ligase family protein n=1 Tax=unclassified Streptomyces TaxID=2593676 RepID=UPI0037A01917
MTAAGPSGLLVDRGIGLAEILAHNARTHPDKTAILHPEGRGPGHRSGSGREIRYGELTYRQLQDRVERLADGFVRAGLVRGTRTVLMARPGPDLFAMAFALFRVGAVPVLVDPGMGLRRMLHCYREVGAEAFIGPPLAHAVRVLGRRTFGGIRTRITLGRRWFWGGETLQRLQRPGGPERQEHAGLPATADSAPRPGGDDLLMIVFTTGSTGPAKGVEYTHRMTAAMARQAQEAFGYDGRDISLVTLPMYGILDLLFGSTVVLAPLSPAKIAQARPEPLIEAMTRFRATTLAASPALLRVLGRYLAQHPTDLPDLRFAAAGGAPVAPEVVADLRTALGPKAALHVTYGATEALPISSIESADILADTAVLSARGAGTCVGRPLPGTEVRIVRVPDAPVSRWQPESVLPAGETGEIVLSGESVSRRYHADPAADARHKIREERPDGTVRLWHRTGDLGYLDTSGRLWFCGRRSQVVHTSDGELHTVSCEGVFNAHPEVRRTALVGVGEPGAQRPVVCVETEPGVGDAQWRRVVQELRQLAARERVTRGLTEFLRHPAFPVDIRHNAKIDRELLGRWAGGHPAPGRAPASARDRAQRAVPLVGWAYLLAGLVHPFDQPLLRTLWWADAFLCVVAHAAQIPWAMERGRAAGHRPAAVIGRTMLYGAAWWHGLPKPAPSRRKP